MGERKRMLHTSMFARKFKVPCIFVLAVFCLVQSVMWIRRDYGLRFTDLLNGKVLMNILNHTDDDGQVLEKSRVVSRTTLSDLQWYESFNHLRSLNDIPDPHYSKIRLLSGKHTFNVGDTIRVNVQLRNGQSQKMKTGGDILRIWAINKSTNSSCAGYIIDHRNGSYTGVLKALFPGALLIRISIAQSKQHIGIFYDYLQREGIWYYMMAKFSKEKVEESTYCSTMPTFSWGKRTCDFTKKNFGIPWYCGAPKKANLTCKDWIAYSAGKANYLLQNDTLKYLYRNRTHQIIKGTIPIQVIGERAGSPAIACNKRRKALTWEDHVPTGYLYNNKFYSLQCRSKLALTRETYLRCLKGRPVLFLGDSSSRYWFVYLTEFLKLKFRLGRWDEIKDKAWQKYAYAERTDLNLSIAWAPHELPMYGGLTSVKNIRSVASRLNEIPPKSRGIVVLHWYLHTARIPPTAYRERVANARDAVLEHLQRSPDISIFIKGPHAIMYRGNTSPHDHLRRINEQILYEEFSSIRDKVTYLDQWDMTVSTENVNVHPPREMNLKMVHHLLSHVC